LGGDRCDRSTADADADADAAAAADDAAAARAHKAPNDAASSRFAHTKTRHPRTSPSHSLKQKRLPRLGINRPAFEKKERTALSLLSLRQTMASPPAPPPSVRFLQLKDVFHRAVTLGIDCLDKEVRRGRRGRRSA
jgi:hypothetical protein